MKWQRLRETEMKTANKTKGTRTTLSFGGSVLAAAVATWVED